MKPLNCLRIVMMGLALMVFTFAQTNAGMVEKPMKKDDMSSKGMMEKPMKKDDMSPKGMMEKPMKKEMK